MALGFRDAENLFVNRAETPGADGTAAECHTCCLPLWAPSTQHCSQLPSAPPLAPSVLAFTHI